MLGKKLGWGWQPHENQNVPAHEAPPRRHYYWKHLWSAICGRVETREPQRPLEIPDLHKKLPANASTIACAGTRPECAPDDSRH